ncbi:hypothetical protein DRO60_02600 [Candidatus Bathyarchaeota archaeon]|nr:MAG: hypothetical protein DRO60_02600 [Candidatus Bathyarchaeota archaeon]
MSAAGRKGLRKVLKGLKEDLSIIKGNFLVLLVTWIIFRMAYGLITPYEPLYIRSLGATPTVLGLMGAASMATFCLSLIPGSYVADRYGRRRVIVVMTFVLGLSYVFYIMAPDWPYSPGWQLILAGMLFASLARLYGPALDAMTADSLPPDKRGVGYAMTIVIPSAFAIASPTVAAMLIAEFGFIEGVRLAYVVVFLSFLLVSAIRFFFLRETVSPAKPTGKMSITRLYAESIKDVVGALRNASRSLKALMLAPLLAMPLSQVFWGTFFPLFVVDFSGITEEEWGTMNSTRLAFSLLVCLPMGKLADRLSRKKLLVVRYVAVAPIVSFLAFANGFVQVLAALLLMDLLSYVGSSAMRALLADLTPRGMRGRVSGARSLLLNLLSIPTAPLTGFIYENIDPRLPFYVISAMSLIIAIALAGLVEEPGEREP